MEKEWKFAPKHMNFRQKQPNATIRDLNVWCHWLWWQKLHSSWSSFQSPHLHINGRDDYRASLLNQLSSYFPVSKISKWEKEKNAANEKHLQAGMEDTSILCVNCQFVNKFSNKRINNFCGLNVNIQANVFGC